MQYREFVVMKISEICPIVKRLIKLIIDWRRSTNFSTFPPPGTVAAVGGTDLIPLFQTRYALSKLCFQYLLCKALFFQLTQYGDISFNVLYTFLDSSLSPRLSIPFFTFVFLLYLNPGLNHIRTCWYQDVCFTNVLSFNLTYDLIYLLKLFSYLSFILTP